MREITVIGAGLAGAEAACQISRRGMNVSLYEMRPNRMTEAHATSKCAELVCSNSFGSNSPHSASRLLKDEIERLGSFVLETAKQNNVPAGESLAVDRETFSEVVTKKLEENPLIKIHREDVKDIPQDGIVIVATGPLTTPELAQSISRLVGGDSLYFYDAISPIVSRESLDLDQMFFQNRYDKGESKDFLNIPLTRDEYYSFVDDLLRGDVVLPHDFEEAKYFEGCLPIEVIASRGKDTLAFGPMKPVGLMDTKSGHRPYAVIQLRTENQYKTAFNLVGFQTKLKYAEQLRIFRKLPGLKNAEFLRLGSMHRNTYLNSPLLLLPTLQLKLYPRIFIAGQLTGTEGYLESSATGLVAGINAVRLALGKALLTYPNVSMLGALLSAITDPQRKNFQPLNANFGILPPLEMSNLRRKLDRPTRNRLYSERSEKIMAEISP